METKPPLTETAYIKLKELKAKIVRLHNSSHEKLLLNLEEHDRDNDEIPSLYHLLKHRKRQAFKSIPQVRDGMHNIQNTPYAILRVFTTEMKSKYDTTSTKGNSIKNLLRHACKKLPLLPWQRWRYLYQWKNYTMQLNREKKKIPGVWWH